MVKLSTTSNPDGGTIPVVFDTWYDSIDVADISIFRAECEGNPTALNAIVTFDASDAAFQENTVYDFEIRVYVLAEGNVSTMMDEMHAVNIAHFDTPWDLMTTSPSEGPIHAVLVKTSLVDRASPVCLENV